MGNMYQKGAISISGKDLTEFIGNHSVDLWASQGDPDKPIGKTYKIATVTQQDSIISHY